MSDLKQSLAKAKNYANKAGIVTGVSLMTAVPAFADPSATETAITSAYSAASSNLTTGVTGLIGLVALVVGVGMIISLFKRA